MNEETSGVHDSMDLEGTEFIVTSPTTPPFEEEEEEEDDQVVEVLEDQYHNYNIRNHCSNEETTTTALNASFDSSLLHHHHQSRSQSQPLRAAMSWDERRDDHNNNNHNIQGGASTKANVNASTSTTMHQAHYLLDMPDLPPAASSSSSSARNNKFRRNADFIASIATISSSAEGGKGGTLTSTPVRLRFRPPGGGGGGGTMSRSSSAKLKAPASAKRHKAPLLSLHHHPNRAVVLGRSPLLHRASKVPRDSTTSTASACTTTTTTASRASLPLLSSASKQQQQHQQQKVDFTTTTTTTSMNEEETTSTGATAGNKKRAPKTSWGTHTTSASTATLHSHSLEDAGYSSCLLLETTTDTIDSCCTNNSADGDTTQTTTTSSTTPFRFTSFPASLPRIHNMPQRSSLSSSSAASNHNHHPEAAATTGTACPSSLTCPASVRKRMSFGGYPNTVADRSHDTSISSSSLLDDGDHILEKEEEDNNSNDHCHQQHPPPTPHPPQQYLLELEQQHSLLHPPPPHHYPDPEEQQQQQSSILGTPVPRTRLNFSSVLSSPSWTTTHEPQPHRRHHGAETTTEEDDFAMQIDHGDDNEVDLSSSNASRPYYQYEPKRVSSFASSVSSVQHNNLSDFVAEDSSLRAFIPHIAAAAASSSGMTPMRESASVAITTATTLLLSNNNNNHNSSSILSGPQTPREVKLHFQLDAAQCSPIPIPGIPEEDGGDLSSKSGAVGGMGVGGRGGAFPSSSTSRKHHHNRDTSYTSSSRLSTSRDDSSSTTTTTTATTTDEKSGSRKRMARRPMPDMTAFEGDATVATAAAGCSSSNTSSSRGDRSLDEYSQKSSTSNSKQQQHLFHHPSSPRLLCPPTPVRTPAWATHCGGDAGIGIGGGAIGGGGLPVFGGGGGGGLVAKRFYARSNSLITTKVLATCSRQVLDGRASLESTSMGTDYNNNNCNNVNTFVQGDRPSSNPKAGEGAPVILEDSAESAPTNSDENWLHDGRGAGGSTGMLQKAIKRESAGEVRAPPAVVSMATHFEIISTLGRGTFADVYRVRSKVDFRNYAVKRNRRQFRGTRDREKALAEVKCMQRLQSVCTKPDRNDKNGRNLSFSLYILFFFQAWQEDGHFFCQTELCCRDTCRELFESLRSQWNMARTRYPSLNKLPLPPNDETPFLPSQGRLFPEESIWKICHDVSAGLSHIHSHGLVHFDIKPSNLFFVPHARFGAICKIGDFGMAGEIGSSEDGQEGDQKYMAPELLSYSDRKHPSADIFSLGLTLYELASSLSFYLPCEGSRWHELRSGHPQTSSDIPACRKRDLVALIQAMLRPSRDDRPTADSILGIQNVEVAGNSCDQFLRDYLFDIEEFDRREEQQMGSAFQEDQTPRHAHSGRVVVCSPTTNMNFLPEPPLLYSPEAAAKS